MSAPDDEVKKPSQRKRRITGPVALVSLLLLAAVGAAAVLMFSLLRPAADAQDDDAPVQPSEAARFALVSAACENGAVRTAPDADAAEGDSVAVIPTPDEGYVLAAVYCQPAQGQRTKLTPDAGGAYHFLMPADAVTVSAEFEPLGDRTYVIRFDADPAAAGGSVTATPSFGKPGDLITLTAQSAEGYALEGPITVSYEQDGRTVTQSVEDGGIFPMPESNVRLAAQFTALFRITVSGGTADRAYAREGETVTVTANAGRGKTFNGWSASGVTLSKSQKNKEKNMTFTMPANDVKLTANTKGADAPTPAPATVPPQTPAPATQPPVQSGPATPAPTPTPHVINAYQCTIGVNGSYVKSPVVVPKGQSITATAGSYADKVFLSWSIQGVPGLSGDALTRKSISFTMPDNDVTLTAQFEAAPAP